MAEDEVSFLIKLKDQFSEQITSAKHHGEAFGGMLGELKEEVLKFAAAYATFEFGKEAIEAFTEQATSLAQIDQILKNTKNAVGETTESLKEMSEKGQEYTANFFEGTQILGAEKTLLPFTNIKKAVYEEAMPAIEDMAAFMGTDLSAAADTVGKALNNPLMAAKLLRSSGISLTEQQQKMIKHFQEVGDMAGAQGIILKELELRYKGAAAAAGNVNPLKQLANIFDEVKESVGEFLVSMIQKLMPFFKGFIQLIKDSIAWMKSHETLMRAIGVAIGVAAGAFIAIGIATKLWAAYQWLLNVALEANPISIVITAIAVFAAGIYYAYQKSETFRTVIHAIGTAFEYVWKFIKYCWAVLVDFYTELAKLAEKTGIVAAFELAWLGLKKVINNVGDAMHWIYEHTIKPIQDAVEKVVAAMNGVSVDEYRKRKGQIDKNAELLDTRRDQVQTLTDKENRMLANGGKDPDSELAKTGTGKPPVPEDKPGLGSGAGDATATKNTVINFQIKNLVNDLKFITNNSSESAAKIKEVVVKALLEAVNDSQIVAGT